MAGILTDSGGLRSFLTNESPSRLPDVLTRRYSSLTERQKEILKLLVVGNSSKDIAKNLGISERTVATHKKQIMGKLGIKDKNQVVYLVHIAIFFRLVTLKDLDFPGSPFEIPNG